jgi:hypothetical protein
MEDVDDIAMGSGRLNQGFWSSCGETELGSLSCAKGSVAVLRMLRGEAVAIDAVCSGVKGYPELSAEP